MPMRAQLAFGSEFQAHSEILHRESRLTAALAGGFRLGLWAVW
jgi:hypothetical protein